MAFKDRFPGASTVNSRLDIEVIAGQGKMIGYGSMIATAKLASDAVTGAKITDGAIPDEVATALPQAIAGSAGGHRAVDYARPTAFLIEVTRAQQRQIARQDERIRALENERASAMQR